MAVPRVRRVEKKPSVSEDTSIWFGRHVMLFAENTTDVERGENTEYFVVAVQLETDHSHWLRRSTDSR